ncbi:MAG: uridine diphosphate-N-acetylglucosamine-binding protein YvcK [Anaerolineales bacterium]|nr:uridine diphosphate-N-acetylglucosamine-binding protein YvcK [Anaerolineales bacterium]
MANENGKKWRTLPRAVHARRLWLTPGLGIKRWLLLLGVGSAMLGMGVVYGIIFLRRVGLLPSSTLYQLLTLQWLPTWVAMLAPLLVGGGLIVLSLARLGRNILAPFRDEYPEVGVAQTLYDHQRRGRGPRIVAIGGGTGLSALLRGLKAYTNNITAIVTVADDGGSSGRLREELGILPPGDFRNNIAALARDEALMTQLLQYRFGEGQTGERSMLRGHAFGNLLLAALVGLTGSFEEALRSAQRVLAIRGRVLPSTLDPVTLMAEMNTAVGRKIVSGESAIPKTEGNIERVFLDPAEARAYPEAIRAIFQADLIVLGPGSLFTSILPNLLVSDLAAALESATAQKVYVCNVATQAGETDGFDVAAHVAVLHQHVSPYCVDLVLANSNVGVRLAPDDSQTVFVRPTAVAGVAMVLVDLVDETRPWRHDSDKLAAELIRLL